MTVLVDMSVAGNGVYNIEYICPHVDILNNGSDSRVIRYVRRKTPGGNRILRVWITRIAQKCISDENKIAGRKIIYDRRH